MRAYLQRELFATEEVGSGLAQALLGEQRLLPLQEGVRRAVTAEDLARQRFAPGGTDCWKCSMRGARYGRPREAA